MNQRWRERLATYRDPAEQIRTTDYEVAAIADDSTPKAFVEQHHYSGSYPAARFRFGLYRRGQLEGVAVFSHPCSDKVLTNVFPVPALEAVELGRFVLLDQVAGNGETWFLGRCFEQLRVAGLFGVVSFSDPCARTAVDGRQVFPGHLGTIYQAHNAVYLGRSTARSLKLLPDGTVLSARTAQKIRRQERGWEHAVEQLRRFGAGPLEGHPAFWLARWSELLTRTFRHPGNHRYTCSRRILRAAASVSAAITPAIGEPFSAKTLILCARHPQGAVSATAILTSSAPRSGWPGASRAEPRPGRHPARAGRSSR